MRRDRPYERKPTTVCILLACSFRSPQQTLIQIKFEERDTGTETQYLLKPVQFGVRLRYIVFASVTFIVFKKSLMRKREVLNQNSVFRIGIHAEGKNNWCNVESSFGKRS